MDVLAYQVDLWNVVYCIVLQVLRPGIQKHPEFLLL
jgi:hypothetical protein